MNVVNSLALVVDDDESVCGVVSAILEEEGFSVVTANSGEEALSLFMDYVFDIVFTDIQMDGMNGFELMEKIRELDSTVKIIVMTGYSSYDAVLQSLKKGAYDYLEKPLEDHARIATTALKAFEYVNLARDNEILLSKLKASHSRLAAANSRLIELNKQLKTLAVTDSLTGMYNRRYVDLALKRELDRYHRFKEPFAVIMLDIDNFKAFNDTYGHDGGDYALKAVADLISNMTRSFDVAGRYGGEEFIMLLANTEVEKAMEIADRLRASVESIALKIGRQDVSLTISAGVTGLDGHEPAIRLNDLLKNADTALYKAKQAGRNLICQHPEAAPEQKMVANG